MNLFNIKRAFKTARERNWDRIYVFVDLHDTICPSNYRKSGEHEDMYPMAQETLEYLSKRKDVKLVLWTCSYTDELKETVFWLGAQGIEMDYVNENPEVENTSLGDFSKKPYVNVILDDKAGFEGAIDWPLVMQAFKDEPILEMR